MATWAELLTDALKEIGVIAAGDAPPAQDMADALAGLNRLLDTWKGERLMIYTVTRTTWSIVPSQTTYTVGSGGQVNIPWPARIEHVNFVDTSVTPSLERPLNPLNDDGWSRVTLKDLTNVYPGFWYITGDFPLATLYLWPVPTSTTLLGAIYAPTPVSEVSSTTATVSLPPGYRRMIVKNLAVEIAPSFQAEVSATLQMQADDSKRQIKSLNAEPLDMGVEAAALGSAGAGRYRWWIYSGP